MIMLMVSQKFTNAEFLQPLIDSMTKVDPGERPTAKEALGHWVKIRETILTVNKEWRPRPREEPALTTVALDVVSLYYVSMYFARALAAGLYRR